MNLQSIKYVFFLGIGGIGMSALARWFHANGYSVSGYDRTPTPLTDALAAEGIAVQFDDDVRHLPPPVLAHPDQTLIVFTPAIPADHAQYNYLKDRGYAIQKRSQVLGLLTRHLRTVAVAGTHGKTTTSSMVAHLLRHAGLNCTAFLGGITQNYGTNFLLNDRPDDLLCVVEADEYDRSFLTLHPDLAIITSTDADHLDIYGDRAALLDSFRAFVAQIKPGGQLFIRQGLNLLSEPPTNVAVAEYSLTAGAYHAANLRIENARFVFDAITPAGTIRDIPMLVPGFHNAENALAAVAVAQVLGLTSEQIRAGLATFRGVKRRFEYVLDTGPTIFIDDYAHHPTEIEAFLTSVKALYPDRKITAVFQPHLFSRTRDFAEGFAASLSLADTLLLLDIYPARELPMPGVTSALIFDRVTAPHKQRVTKEELPDLVRQQRPELLVTIGAGDVDAQVPILKDLLTSPAYAQS